MIGGTRLLTGPAGGLDAEAHEVLNALADDAPGTSHDHHGVVRANGRDAYLFLAADEESGRAVGRLLARVDGGPLQARQNAIRGIRLSARGRNGILAGPMDLAIDQPLAAGLDAWGALGAAGGVGELVVVVLRTVRRADELQALCESAAEAVATFRDDAVPIRMLAVAALLRPPDRLDLRPLRGMDGLALPPVLLNLMPPSGPLPAGLVPDLLAEWLEVLVTCGPAGLLGEYRAPRPTEHALVVALDAVEAPDTAEASYLHSLVLHRWLLALLRHEPAARVRQVAPAEATTRSAARIVEAAGSDRQRIDRATEAACREAGRTLEALADPRLLRPLPPDEQRSLVETQNRRVVGPLRSLLFQRLADAYAHGATVSEVARTEANRLIGNFLGGISLAESCLTDAAGRLRDAHRAADDALPGHPGPCDEPSLAIEPDETDELVPVPRAAPWRTTLAWLALLASGLACLAASLPPLQNPPDWLVRIFGDDAGVAELALLLISPLTLLILGWQLGCWAMLRLELRKVAAQPIRRYGQRLARWRGWLVRHGLPNRQAEDVARELDRIRLLRERLEALVEHLAHELDAARARLVGPAFPRVLARRATSLEAMERGVLDRWDIDRMLRALAERWQTGDDLAAYGGRLAGLLESTVLQAGPDTSEPSGDEVRSDRRAAQAGDNGDDALRVLAWQAVAEEVRTRRREPLDERLGRPGTTLVQLLGRTVPAGARYEGAERALVGEPESRLAQVAAAAGCRRFDRADHERAALVVVSAMRL